MTQTPSSTEDPFGAIMSVLGKTASEISVATDKQKVEAARQNVNNAQIRLSSLSQKIPKENIVSFQYPIYNMKANAILSCSIKFIDVISSDIIHIEGIAGEYSEQDKYIERDDVHNVIGDPLEISDEEYF